MYLQVYKNEELEPFSNKKYNFKYIKFSNGGCAQMKNTFASK
jgi:hypothetical protein